MMENGYKISTHILNDLCCRFIVNMPKEQLSDPIRVCFQIELAYWFFVDHYEEVQKKKSYNLRDFIKNIFAYLPCLQDYASTCDDIIAMWRDYKTKVPTFGAILLDKELENIVLVQGESAKSSWGFPKGKVNEAEPPHMCAIREVREETGYDISSSVGENLYFERKINDTLTRLYVVTGVDKNYAFQPETKNEIRKIKWFHVDDLPLNRNDNTKNSFGIYASHFYGVVPFVESIREWIDGVKNGGKRKTPPCTLQNGFGRHTSACGTPSPVLNGHSSSMFTNNNSSAAACHSKSTVSFVEQQQQPPQHSQQQQQRSLSAKQQQRFNQRQRAKSFTASVASSTPSSASAASPSSSASCQARSNGYYHHNPNQNHHDPSSSHSFSSYSQQHHRYSPASKNNTSTIVNVRAANSANNFISSGGNKKGASKNWAPKQRLFQDGWDKTYSSATATAELVESTEILKDKVLNGKHQQQQQSKHYHQHQQQQRQQKFTEQSEKSCDNASFDQSEKSGGCASVDQSEKSAGASTSTSPMSDHEQQQGAGLSSPMNKLQLAKTWLDVRIDWSSVV